MRLMVGYIDNPQRWVTMAVLTTEATESELYAADRPLSTADLQQGFLGRFPWDVASVDCYGTLQSVA